MGMGMGMGMGMSIGDGCFEGDNLFHVSQR